MKADFFGQNKAQTRRFYYSSAVPFWAEVDVGSDFLTVRFCGLPPAHGEKKVPGFDEFLADALKKSTPKEPIRLAEDCVFEVTAVYPEGYRYPLRGNSRAYLSGLVNVIQRSKIVPYRSETHCIVSATSRVEDCTEPYTEVRIFSK